MWTNTITIKFRGKEELVLVWLMDSSDTGSEVVRMQSMYNEWYLIEDIEFPNRDAAYSFIKNCPKSLAKEFFIRVGYNNSAIE